MATKELPAPKLLRKLITYNPETGEATWRTRPATMFTDGAKTKEHRAARWNSRHAGALVGHASARMGYKQCTVWGTQLLVHRVLWALHYGAWPEGEIDHINHDRTDNRLANLRDVPKITNSRNQSKRKDNSTGATGVRLDRRYGTWMAGITIEQKRIHLGSFKTKEAAIAARRKAELFYGFHPNHGC